MTIKDAFWKIHANLPRQAPGSEATTRKLLDLAAQEQHYQSALDIGCGPGRSALVLAAAGIQVTAIDTHQPFLDELKHNLKAAGLDEKVSAECVSMGSLPYDDQAFDLLWAEGTSYIIGWRRALTEWKRLLKPGGKLVATDCHWLTDTPSEEVKKFWDEAYPGMPTIEESVRIAEEEGYIVEHTEVLPDKDWEEYYRPLHEKHLALASDPDPTMQKALAVSRREIDIRERFGQEYGYVGFILRLQD